MRSFLHIFLFSCLSLQAVVVAKLRGQLGNQMFQVAAAVALAEENHCQVHFPDFEILRMNNWGEMELVKNYNMLFHRIPNRLKNMRLRAASQYHEWEGGAYTPIPYRPNQEIVGYFQSEKFFKKYEPLIRELYRMPTEIENIIRERYPDILAHPKTVGIHVRTWYDDYRRRGFDPNIYKSLTPPDLEFYSQAIEMFDEDSLFVICSDHIGWCKKSFSCIPRNFVFIDSGDYFVDLYLLSLCKDNIITASTFGWWGAYLNEHPEKRVICRSTPNQSSPDLFCDDWIKITRPLTLLPVPVFE